MRNIFEQEFKSLANKCFTSLPFGVKASMYLYVEESDFVRYSKNRVRQNSHVLQADLSVTIQNSKTELSFSLPFSDISEIYAEFTKRVSELPSIPELASFAPIAKYESTEVVSVGNYLKPEEFEKVLEITEGLDFVGMYQAGSQLVMFANSEGTNHLFYKESFAIDYSVFFEGDRSIKGGYAGKNWSLEDWQNRVKLIRMQEEAMTRPEKVLTPGEYRAYLTPAALEEVSPAFNWYGFSEREFRNKTSAWLKMKSEGLKLSEKFSLAEDMTLGLSLPFSLDGAPVAKCIQIIKNGELKNTLVDSKMAKEYEIESNGAFSGGYTISTHMQGGTLKESEILEKLGTGVYISNLHYFNWSDPSNLRITGMTRYACFWVENGKIVAPIKHMRFDDSFTRMFGSELIDLTEKAEHLVDLRTYGERSLTGQALPGLLLKSFAFTL